MNKTWWWCSVSKPPPIRQCYCDKEDIRKSWLQRLVENNVDYERQKRPRLRTQGLRKFLWKQQCLISELPAMPVHRKDQKFVKNRKKGPWRIARRENKCKQEIPYILKTSAQNIPRYPLKWPILYIENPDLFHGGLTAMKNVLSPISEKKMSRNAFFITHKQHQLWAVLHWRIWRNKT